MSPAMDQFTPDQIRPEIEALLRRLRRRIRRYVLLEGTALLLVLLTGLFWLSLALDWAYFQVSALELPVWVRQTATILMLCLFVFSGTVWVVLRSLRSLRRDALALVLERRFPELNDRLITAVEAAESFSGRLSPVTAAMLARTVDDVAQLAGRLELSAVFDRAPLRRAVVLAAVLLTSVAGLAWAHPPAVSRWTRAYLQWEPEYWPRQTHLVVKVLAQPGDRVVEFRDGQYKHPRGADLTVLIEVPAGRPGGPMWKIPPRVQLAYELADGGGSGRATCFQVSDEQLLRRERAAAIFRYSAAGLLSGLEFTVQGGDFASRTPLRVVVVDAPRIDRVELDCDYPAYTGLGAAAGERRVPVYGAQVSLPVETRFVMHAAANKPLVRARVAFAPYELEIRLRPDRRRPRGAPGGARQEPGAADSRRGQVVNSRSVILDSGTATPPGGNGAEKPLLEPISATLTELSETGEPLSATLLPADVARRLFSSDRRTIVVPWVLSRGTTEAARRRIRLPLGGFPQPFVLAPETEVRIYLEDADGVISGEPARLTIGGIADAPPVVETELRGIGPSITRQASIPVAGRVSDDYGLRRVRFDFRIDDETGWQSRPLSRGPAEGAPEFRLGSPDDPLERFHLTALNLAVGQKLTLALFAEDGDDLNGPHAARGPRHEFQIVSAEELLAIVYAKELNLRQRFEQLIAEVEAVGGELRRQRVAAEELAVLGSRPGDAEGMARLEKFEASLAASAERSLYQANKNAEETRAIQAGFQDLLHELVNNAVHTRQMLDRIEGLIVRPLGRICEQEFRRLDAAVRALGGAGQRRQNAGEAIDAAIAAADDLVAQMRRILGEMEDLAEFHQALKHLQLIIEDQEQLREATKSRHKRSFIQRLKELGLEDQ